MTAVLSVVRWLVLAIGCGVTSVALGHDTEFAIGLYMICSAFILSLPSK